MSFLLHNADPTIKVFNSHTLMELVFSTFKFNTTAFSDYLCSAFDLAQKQYDFEKLVIENNNNISYSYRWI